jgi:hypothetical protein
MGSVLSWGSLSDSNIVAISTLWAFRKSSSAEPGAVKLMSTRIRLLAQPKSIHSIIDATRREQRHVLA